MDSNTDIINLSYPEGTLGSLSYPEKFNHQAFEQIKQVHLVKERLFVDNTFPPNNTSLGDLTDLSAQQIQKVEWLRPADILKRNNITEDISFINEESTTFDFAKGFVGNSWFLAAVASLTIQKEMLWQIVPQQQNFTSYAGIFHFRFWRFGRWVDVVIDDFLPVIGNRLLFTHSKTGTEFWAPLLEKAYAKVCGSYADMHANLPTEAFKDFSGGVHMTFELQKNLSEVYGVDLWEALSKATTLKSMICCGTINKGNTVMNSVAHTGLVNGYAYPVTGIMEIEHMDNMVKLVKLMNPWGKTEWNGNWSVKSTLWEEISSEDREKALNLSYGEFWMEMKDFIQYFDMLSIFCEKPNFLDGDVTSQWRYLINNGRWVAGVTAGGNISEATFANNPQYRLIVKETDNEITEKNVLISLMQKPAERLNKEIRYNPIGLTIFKLTTEITEERLDAELISTIQPLRSQQMYTTDRELIEFHRLEAGEYLLLPSTMVPNRSGEFVLSVYSKNDIIMTDSFDKIDASLISQLSEDDNMNLALKTFKRYADQNGELSIFQLQRLLKENLPNGYSFDLENCRSIIALMDTKHNGIMTFNEFLVLWNKFDEFKKIFRQADISQTGTLTYEELLTAIKEAGLEVDDKFVNLLTKRYSEDTSMIISMENFLALMLRLEHLDRVFKDKATDGIIHMDWNDWSHVILYA